MTMNAQDRHWDDVYTTMPEAERDAIDEVFKEAVRTLRRHGLQCAKDDRAGQLTAAITRFVVESKEST